MRASEVEKCCFLEEVHIKSELKVMWSAIEGINYRVVDLLCTYNVHSVHSIHSVDPNMLWKWANCTQRTTTSIIRQMDTNRPSLSKMSCLSTTQVWVATSQTCRCTGSSRPTTRAIINSLLWPSRPHILSKTSLTFRSSRLKSRFRPNTMKRIQSKPIQTLLPMQSTVMQMSHRVQYRTGAHTPLSSISSIWLRLCHHMSKVWTTFVFPYVRVIIKSSQT